MKSAPNACTSLSVRNVKSAPESSLMPQDGVRVRRARCVRDMGSVLMGVTWGVTENSHKSWSGAACARSSLIDVISLPVTVSRTPTVRAPALPLLSPPAP